MPLEIMNVKEIEIHIVDQQDQIVDRMLMTHYKEYDSRFASDVLFKAFDTIKMY